MQPKSPGGSRETPPRRRSSQSPGLTTQGKTSKASILNSLPSSKEEGCNCKKSFCLKLYCKCFGAGNLCGKNCFCANCRNMRDNMERSEAINLILEKDPLGFYGEVSRKGCNCKKSNCLKKYCECFRQGRACCELCYCLDCSNGCNSARLRSKKE